MQVVRSTLNKTSVLALVFAIVLLALGAYLYRQPKPLARVKAASEPSKTVTTVGQTAASASVPADVTVNGQHIEVPANGSKTLNLSSGETVNVSASQSGGSTTVTTSPNGSVSVSSQSSSNNSAPSSSTQVYSNSFSQSNSWSQDGTFSTSTSNVQVTH